VYSGCNKLLIKYSINIYIFCSSKEVRVDLSAVHSRLDRQEEMLSTLLELMAARTSKKQHRQEHQVKVKGGGGSEHMPKVDS